MKQPRFILADIAQKLEDARLAYSSAHPKFGLGDYVSAVHKIEELARQAAWDLSDEAIGKAPTEQTIKEADHAD